MKYKYTERNKKAYALGKRLAGSRAGRILAPIAFWIFIATCYAIKYMAIGIGEFIKTGAKARLPVNNYPPYF